MENVFYCLNARIKGTNRICSVNIYDTPIYNLRAGKKSSKENLSVTQAYAKVMFHTIASLWVMSDPFSSLFQTNDFPYPVGRFA